MLKVCCIYRIRNVYNDKYYLGSCLSAVTREKKHFSDLRKQRHHCIHLQRAYNKHGRSAFVFEVIEICRPRSRKKKEQEYLNKLDFSKLYNVSRTASGGNMIYNHPDKERILKEKTEILLKYNQTPENIMRLKSMTGSKNPNYGNRWSKKLRKKVSKIVKNRLAKRSPEAKKTEIEKMKASLKVFWNSEQGLLLKKKLSKKRKGKKNGFYGRQHSKKTKKVLSVKHKGKSNPTCWKSVTIEGAQYKNIQEASISLNIPVPTIHFRVNSLNENFKEWNYTGNPPKQSKKRIIHNCRKYRIKDKTYVSIAEASRQSGLTQTQLVFRAKSQDQKWKDYSFLD